MDSFVGDVALTAERIDELIRWHGTDEGSLPPAHTLAHLGRDTVAAMHELLRAREQVRLLRAAMGRAFWAADPRELHTLLLDALGPPPEVEEVNGSLSSGPHRAD